jgi:hypothetical protein
MKKSNSLVWLSSLVVILALIASSVGLFWSGGGGSFTFTTIHGQTVQIYGQGLYHYDTSFKGPLFRGTDAVTLFICIPLLILAIILYRQGSLRGGLLLSGMLGYFLYNSASLAFGVAYNNLILVYITSFSASLFAFVLALLSVNLETLSMQISPRSPRRGMAIFLILAGLSVFIWLIDIAGGLVANQVPQGIASYTTEVTYVIDLGVIAPAAFLASALLFRHHPLGYLLGCVLLILNAIIGVVVVGQTVSQSLAGITLGVGQFIGYAGTFVIMCAVAIVLLVLFFRNISEPEVL